MLKTELNVETTTPAVPWKPFPAKPQQVAYFSPADEVFYGGAAGSGKSELLIGLALTQHRKSIIFRREFPQLKAIVERLRELVPSSLGSYNGQEHVWKINDGRSIELGAVQHEWDVDRYMGRPHDFLGFDELSQFTQSQYRFLLGWNRTSTVGQRCRVVGAGNPPLNPEGYWVLEEWAPWLDEKFTDPADPGELRWYAMLSDENGQRLEWFKTGHPIEHNGEVIQPRSRTFIPGHVDDNPVLIARGYKSVLQSLPEPLRSKLLYGSMSAGLEDDPWQVIPTAWVREAQKRWKPDGAGDTPLSAVGVDVARGGKDKTVLAKRYKTWWAPLAKFAGSATPDGPHVIELIRRETDSRPCLVCVDVIGVGASVYDLCVARKWNAMAVNSAEGTNNRDSTGHVEFGNLRAWAYWRMRELLDPSNPLHVDQPPQLPDDRELLADLTAPRFRFGPSGVMIEKKEDIQKRIGRSPDSADAVVYSILVPNRRSTPEPVVYRA